MDAETKVFMELKEVLWRTVAEEDRRRCRVPLGCESVECWVDDRRGRRRRQDDETEGDADGVEESESSSSSEGLSA